MEGGGLDLISRVLGSHADNCPVLESVSEQEEVSGWLVCVSGVVWIWMGRGFAGGGTHRAGMF